MSLRNKVIRLAYQNPNLRPHLLPLLRRKQAADWQEVSRSDLSPDLLDRVWDMYKASYAKIGLKASSVDEMVSDYDVWRIAYEGDVPVAFSVATSTPFGVKSGLSGSDGSAAGKGILKKLYSTIYKQSGNYAEVSHAVEHIVTKSGAPVVCAVYAPMILKKKVDISEDGIHYSRNLQNVGKVTKVLVGRPRGIPTTDYDRPLCPATDPSMRQSGEIEADTLADFDAHFSCLMFRD